MLELTSLTELTELTEFKWGGRGTSAELSSRIDIIARIDN